MQIAKALLCWLSREQGCCCGVSLPSAPLARQPGQSCWSPPHPAPQPSLVLPSLAGGFGQLSPLLQDRPPAFCSEMLPFAVPKQPLAGGFPVLRYNCLGNVLAAGQAPWAGVPSTVPGPGSLALLKELLPMKPQAAFKGPGAFLSHAHGSPMAPGTGTGSDNCCFPQRKSQPPFPGHHYRLCLPGSNGRDRELAPCCLGAGEEDGDGGTTLS